MSDSFRAARAESEFAGGGIGAPATMGDMDEAAATILVVEDHKATRTFLADNLSADGYELLESDCAATARHLIETRLMDALLRWVRDADRACSHADPDLPLLVVSGRSGELDRLRGFARGADDYVVKPFSYQELLARVRALLRRTSRRPRLGRLRVGALEVDPVARQVWLRGEPVSLSKKEFALLRALAAEPTRVFTREELLRGVWGFRSMGATRTLDSHAHRLRKKLQSGPDRFVINVWGVGYRLVDGPIAR